MSAVFDAELSASTPWVYQAGGAKSIAAPARPGAITSSRSA
jgi:hypothetical protein